MRQFLKYTFASLVGNILGFLVLSGLGAGGLIFLIVAAASRETGPQVKNSSILVFDLGLTINDTNPISTTGEALSEALSSERNTTITLRNVLDSLKEAATDDRIVGLYLDGSGSTSSNGLASLKEVRAALEKFRESGKPIYAYDVDWQEQKYYLGSVADTIFINPMGAVEVNGFSSEMMFLAGAFQKYGIGVQVIRVGKYKSAVEPFTQTQLSPENRQQTQGVLNDLWQDFLTVASRHRELTPQQLQAIADTEGFLLAENAQQRGLVDRIAYFDEVVAELKEVTGNSEDEDSFNQISLPSYSRVANRNASVSRNRIAVVYAEGDIVDGQGGVRSIGGDRFASQMRTLRQDDRVKAIVLRVNSPGGSATASEIIGREVELTRQAKPVIVSMGNYAASGGYWIAAYSDRIFAETSTITGSIGVFGLLPNIQRLANDNGITWDTIKTGRFADSQSITRPKTPQEIAIYQNSVNRIYEQFLNHVSTSRNLPPARVAEIAQGRVWSGQEAKNLGLVDEIGGLEAAIAFAAEKAEIADDWQLEEYPRTRSLEERLIGRFISQTERNALVKRDRLTLELHKLQAELAFLQNLNDPRGVYARLPFQLRID
ncbi:signal peptide peptidase SppA [Desertifilum sp. FACHB-1129]|uniref:Protease 4 n=1 Tax=Desertifilum tharense IPPAS B-1220 TaxID=1781255 RepID=A0A1E5QIU0_9CYAN|nr:MULTISPECIES: signal peptide peptidase SppA [Desertifilum]MCD8489637.1 signal peptide peptidase SppA [Desertifilum sp.]MDA0209443.1 signal peptide peptidase SppA [Cyanobacteria bacterium FC1]MDI9641835.1 signal peptide peptidase SppA [Geitlerinema splendidum]MBD2314322.1 signal peptide peptidase SppA [Desertifilum sp. FACHB-1129]MBD2324599.1 signal peptide peptidase SppA [Desertifilum sp. FACHB-866]